MKNILRTGVTLLLAVVLLCSSIPFQKVSAETVITDKEYQLTLDKKEQFFLGSEKAVSGEVGTKVFLTYTVEKTTYTSEHLQLGVVGTTDPKAIYPYENGGTMVYGGSADLFSEGYTYFFCFERTEEGFQYEGYKSNGKDEQRLVFTINHGPGDGAYTHFGLWAAEYNGGSISTTLNHMRCYDEAGNDLGIYVSGKIEDVDKLNDLLDVHPVVNGYYDITIENAAPLAISNGIAPKDNDSAVYMEYEVEEVSRNKIIQMGLICTKEPDVPYPFEGGAGLMHWQEEQDGKGKYSLLYEGAKYFICFKKEADDFIGIVQRTVKGVTETTTYSLRAGQYNRRNAFYSLWFAEGEDFSAKLKNFKCYDENGNNLGVQFSIAEGIQATYVGEIMDYSKSVSAYYCKANGQVLALADDRSAYLFDAKGQKQETASYKIVNDTTLILVYESGKEMYNYTDMVIADAEGNRYERLGKKTITYVSGSSTTTVDVTLESGYRSIAPETPVRENDTFQGWYLADGTKYEFGELVTESITLYAKWDSEKDISYVPVDSETEDGSNYAWIVPTAVSLLLVVITVIVCIKMKSRKESRN